MCYFWGFIWFDIYSLHRTISCCFICGLKSIHFLLGISMKSRNVSVVSVVVEETKKIKWEQNKLILEEKAGSCGNKNICLVLKS